MNNLFLPLQGPGGTRPKAPAQGAWQSPGYTGLTHNEAHNAYEQSNHAMWFGMRTDGLVVVDCDCQDAYDRWYEHTFPHQTWVRKTPRGWHFIYDGTHGSPDGPSADIFGGGSHIDIRAGRTSQIVYYAPGYFDHCGDETKMIPFQPSWLPQGFTTDRAAEHFDESWSEVPDGRGNNTMTAIAGAMRKQGMDLPTMATCLGAINAICMTRDPMPAEMIVDIVTSVGRYKANPDIDLVVE